MVEGLEGRVGSDITNRVKGVMDRVADVERRLSDTSSKMSRIEGRLDSSRPPPNVEGESPDSRDGGYYFQEEVERLADMVNITASTIQSLRVIIDEMGASFTDSVAGLRGHVDSRCNELEGLRSELSGLSDRVTSLTLAVEGVSSRVGKSSRPDRADSKVDELQEAVEQNSVSSQLLFKSIRELEQSFNTRLGSVSGDLEHLSSLVVEFQAVISEIHASVDERLSDIDSRTPTLQELAREREGGKDPGVDLSGLDARISEAVSSAVAVAKQEMVGILQEVFGVVNKYQEQIIDLNECVSSIFDDERFRSLERLVSLYGDKLESAAKRVDSLSNSHDVLRGALDRAELSLGERISKLSDMRHIESRVSELVSQQVSEQVSERVSELDFEGVRHRLHVLEDEVIPTFSETMNQLMDSALHNISTEIINRSVEKIIYEILEKLEDRVSSIRGIKETVGPVGPVGPVGSVGSDSRSPVRPGVQRPAVAIPSIKATPPNIKSQSATTGATKDDVVNGAVMEKIRAFSKDVAAVHVEVSDLRSEFEDFKGEISGSLSQIFTTIHSNNGRIEARLRDAEASEARASAIFSRIEENSSILEEKIRSINETIQSGSRTIRKLNSLVKKSKDSAKNFERLNFERIWTEKLSAERDQEHPPGGFMGFESAASDDDGRYTIDYYKTSQVTSSPVIERYVVPVGETQVAVTRQYVELPEQQMPVVQYPISVLDNTQAVADQTLGQTVYLQYDNPTGYGYESPDAQELSPGNAGI